MNNRPKDRHTDKHGKAKGSSGFLSKPKVKASRQEKRDTEQRNVDNQ